jgi:hypothetical protein
MLMAGFWQVRTVADLQKLSEDLASVRIGLAQTTKHTVDQG